MTLTCRWLGADDVTAWRDLRGEALRLQPDAFLTSLAEFEARTDAELAEQLAQGNMLGAWRGDMLIGSIGYLRKGRPSTNHRAGLAAVYVRATDEGQGVARAMMHAVEARAAHDGVVQLELWVWDGNARAVQFYERCGFERMGRMPRAVITRGEPKDDLFMVRALDR